jgi:hypothetical protein
MKKGFRERAANTRRVAMTGDESFLQTPEVAQVVSSEKLLDILGSFSAFC